MMHERRGAALVSVLLLLLTATALAHGGLLLARAELRASAERVRRESDALSASVALDVALRTRWPTSIADLPVWERRVIGASVSGRDDVVRTRRMAPESWWLEYVADSAATRRVGSPARLVWWMDPLERLRALGAVLSVGTDASATIRGSIDLTRFGSVPALLDGAACGIGLEAGPIDFAPTAVRLLPSGLERPTLGLLAFDTMLDRTRVSVDRGGAPEPVVRGGACVDGEPWSWGDPERPSAPCGGVTAVRAARDDLRIRGGVGHVALVVDGDVELSGDARLYGFVLATGSLILREQAELHGVGVAMEGVTVEAGARVEGSACWAARALGAARAEWMPTPIPDPGAPVVAP